MNPFWFWSLSHLYSLFDFHVQYKATVCSKPLLHPLCPTGACPSQTSLARAALPEAV